MRPVLLPSDSSGVAVGEENASLKAATMGPERMDQNWL
jgi:hypothetical protein